MSKSAMIRARIEPELKEEVEAILTDLGLTPTEAICIYYKQIAMAKGIPFEIRIPNAKMRKVIRDAKVGKGLINYESLDDLMADIKA